MAYVIKTDRIKEFIDHIVKVKGIKQKGVRETLIIAMNKYFADKQTVLPTDLEKLNPELVNLKTYDINTPLLKGKFLNYKKPFSLNELKGRFQYLDKIPNKYFKENFVINKTSLFGYHRFPKEDGFKLSKEEMKILSDKMKEVIAEFKIKDGNFFRIWLIIKIIIGESTDVKNHFNALTELDKLFLSNIIDIPIDLTKVYNLYDKELLKLDHYMHNIIKQDTEIGISIKFLKYAEQSVENIINLVDDHLKDHKVKVRMSKQSFSLIRQSLEKLNLEGEFVDVVEKFPEKLRKSEKQSDDGRISISIY